MTGPSLGSNPTNWNLAYSRGATKESMKLKIILWALVALLAMAPAVSAQDEEKPREEPAGTGDRPTYDDSNCPPDMMCASGSDEGNTSEGEVKDGGNAWSEDCPPDMYCMYSGRENCEYCRNVEGNDTPVEYGPDGSGHEEGGICHTRPEACYSQAPVQDSNAEAEAVSKNTDDAQKEAPAKAVPAAGVFALLAGLGVAAFALSRKA